MAAVNANVEAKAVYDGLNGTALAGDPKIIAAAYAVLVSPHATARSAKRTRAMDELEMPGALAAPYVIIVNRAIP